MKTLGRMAVSIIVGSLVLGRIHAQEQTTAGGIPIAEIPPPPALDLPVIAPANVPETGNFFSAGHDDWPPLPYSPYREVNLLSNNVPTYLLKPADWKGGMSFLLFDDRAIVAVETMEAMAQEKEALLRPMNKRQAADSTESSEPKTLARGLVAVAEGIQLDIADITNGVASVDILNATGDTNLVPWDLWFAGQFTGEPDGWTWLTRVEAGVTNVLVTLPSETEAYFRLGATNNTHSVSNVPDSWMSQHFGHVLEWSSDHTLPTDDFDGDGISNYDEFLAGTDPNDISFTAHIGYGQTATLNPTVTISVLNGTPSYLAVVVDSTNFANPAWQPFTTNPIITLPNSDGEHIVWVALRGRVNATAWLGFGVTLDRVAPVLLITAPSQPTNSKPIIQVQGFATEQLAGVTYAISNAVGIQTNLAGGLTGLTGFHGEGHTNYFQLFDVDLTNGINTLTILATDLAGNSSSLKTNLVFDLSGDTNAPTLNLIWPTNGCVVGQTVVSLRAQTDDETASIFAQFVDVNGETNVLSGLVERDGLVWIAGLPLNEGTNTFQLVITDAAANTTATNLTVIRSAVNLSIDPVAAEYLNQSEVTVTGTVSDTNCVVAVNGVTAGIAGDGSWSAANVPVPSGDTATFGATATFTGGSGLVLSSERDDDKPPEIKLVHGTWYDETGSFADNGAYEIGRITQTWDENAGGHWIENHEDNGGTTTHTYLIDTVPLLHTPLIGGGELTGLWAGRWEKGSLNWRIPVNANSVSTGVRQSDAFLNLVTHGKKALNASGVYIVTADLAELFIHPVLGLSAAQIPHDQVTVRGQTTDSNHQVVVTQPNGTSQPINPQAPVAMHTNAMGVAPLKIPLTFRNSGQLTQRETNNIGYQVSIYDAVTNYTRSSTLGTANPTVVYQGKQLFFNFVEINANVPTNATFDSGWKWHQDVSVKAWTFIRNPGTGGVLLLPQASDSQPFTSPLGGEGEGNDGQIDAAADKTPDSNRLILFADAPGPTFATNSPPFPLHDVVLAQRFYGHTWLTWNGALVADVLHWKSFCTFRRFASGGWERKGTNILEQISVGSPEIPAFSSQEGTQVLNEP